MTSSLNIFTITFFTLIKVHDKARIYFVQDHLRLYFVHLNTVRMLLVVFTVCYAILYT